MAGLQGTDLAKQLAADDAAGKVGPEFKGHYTVIVPGAALAHWLAPRLRWIAQTATEVE